MMNRYVARVTSTKFCKPHLRKSESGSELSSSAKFNIRQEKIQGDLNLLLMQVESSSGNREIFCMFHFFFSFQRVRNIDQDSGIST